MGNLVRRRLNNPQSQLAPSKLPLDSTVNGLYILKLFIINNIYREGPWGFLRTFLPSFLRFFPDHVFGFRSVVFVHYVKRNERPQRERI